MTDKNYIYKKLSDGRYVKEIDSKTEHLASAEEDAKLATDIRSLLQGVQGESGTSGTSGQDGTSGRDGVEGRMGRTGLTGPRGLNGTSGSSGSSGQDGSSGQNGQDGTSGVNGRKGEKGDKGDRGFPGLQGPAGQNGSAGVSGTSGTSAPGITSGTSGSSGTSGTSGMNGISAGQVYYFNKSQSSDVSPYKVLDLSPSGTSQQTSTASLTGNQKGLLIDSYLTPELAFGVIPAGVQRFHHHLLKPASNDEIEFYVEIQLADSSGTPIGPTLSTNKALIGWVDATTPNEVVTDLVLPTTTIDPTSRMIVRLYLDNNDSTSHTVVHYTEGISHYSFVTTSVGVIGSTSGSSGTSGVNGTSGSSGVSLADGLYYGRQGFSGANIDTGIGAAGMGAAGMNVNKLNLSPFIFGKNLTISSITTEVTTSVAGSSIIFGVYTDLNGRPNTPIFFSGTQSSATNGLKTYNIPSGGWSISANTLYWFFCCAGTNGVNMRANTQANTYSVQAQFTQTSSKNTYYTFDSTFPNIPTSITQSSCVLASGNVTNFILTVA